MMLCTYHKRINFKSEISTYKLMKEIKSLKSLGCTLSRLKQIESINITNEQYQTPSEIASEILWSAMFYNDITDNIIYDLGCGNGIFGIGALLCGALNCTFIDSDSKAIEILKENLTNFEFSSDETNIKNIDIKEFKDEIITEELKEKFEDKNINIKKVVIMNPPFGTKKIHADKDFLIKSFQFADVIYSMHLKDTIGFLNAISNDYNFKITHSWEFDFAIKKSHVMHKKNKLNVPVICVRMEKY